MSETMKTETLSSKKKKREHVSLAKQLMLEEIEKEFHFGESVFFSRFDRLNVQDMSELRRNLQRVSRRTLVAKHTLLKKALEKIKASDAGRFLEGSVLVTLSGEEPQLVSKTLVEFMKGRENLELKGMILDGKVYEGKWIKELAKIPSRKELLGALAVRMQSPITQLAIAFKGILRSLAVVLNEVQKKKSQEGNA